MSYLDIRHKETFRLFIREFIELFFPELLSQFNFETVRFMDKELIDLFGEQDTQGIVDVLLSIERKKDGRWTSSLIHWEQQGKRKPGFGERMFHYFSGLYFRYRKDILPIVLFTDNAVWRKPVLNKFRVSFGRFSVIRSQFNLIKLKSFLAVDFMKLAPDNPLVWAYLPLTNYKRKERVRIVCLGLEGVMRTVKDERKCATLVSLILHSVNLNAEELIELKRMIAKELQFKEVRMLNSLKEVFLEMGHAQGRKEGIEEGKRQATLQNVKLFLENGASWELIKKATGITEAEFQKYLEEEAELLKFVEARIRNKDLT